MAKGLIVFFVLMANSLNSMELKEIRTFEHIQEQSRINFKDRIESLPIDIYKYILSYLPADNINKRLLLMHPRCILSDREAKHLITDYVETEKLRPDLWFSKTSSAKIIKAVWDNHIQQVKENTESDLSATGLPEKFLNRASLIILLRHSKRKKKKTHLLNSMIFLANVSFNAFLKKDAKTPWYKEIFYEALNPFNLESDNNWISYYDDNNSNNHRAWLENKLKEIAHEKEKLIDSVSSDKKESLNIKHELYSLGIDFYKYIVSYLPADSIHKRLLLMNPDCRLSEEEVESLLSDYVKTGKLRPDLWFAKSSSSKLITNSWKNHINDAYCLYMNNEVSFPSKRLSII